MKAFSSRLKSIPIPETTRKNFLIPARYSSIEYYKHLYKKEQGIEAPTPNPYTSSVLKKAFPQVDFDKPWVVELGTGTGEFIIHLAQEHTHKLFIGVDAVMPCIERALQQLSQQKNPPTNVLFYNGLALDFLQADFNGCSFHEILVNFPDPWPKKRHIKRRLISPTFIETAVKALIPKGVLITATDSKELWSYHLEIITSCEQLQQVDLKTLPSHAYYQFFSRYRKKNLANTPKCYFTAHQTLLPYC